MPKCEHEHISTHGQCLACHTQVFTSIALNKAGDPAFCQVARVRLGLLKRPEYREIEGR